MATFELTAPDGKTYEIDAADIGAAQKAFGHAFGGSGASAPPSPPAALQGGIPGDVARFDEAAGARATQKQYEGYAGVRVGAPGDRTADLGNELTRRADEMLVGEDGAGNRAMNAGMNFANTIGLSLPSNAVAGLQTLPGIGTGKSFRENFQGVEDRLSALARQSPGARDLGTIGGVVGSMNVPVAQIFNPQGMGGRIGNTALTVGGAMGVNSLAEDGLDRATDPEALGKAALYAAGGAAGGSLLHGALEYGAPMAAKLAERALGKKAPDVPASAPADAFPKGVSPAIANEAEAAQFGIPLTKGQATGEYSQQARESLLARGPDDAEPARVMREFFKEQEGQVAAAKGDIGRRFGDGADVVERPYDAGVRVADFARNSQRLADTVAGGQEAGAAAARGNLAAADPLDTAASVATGVRGRAAADKAAFKSSYDEASRAPGAFEPGTFDKVAPSIERRMAASERPFTIDPTLTPATSRAMADLRANPPTGSSMADVDQARKRLVMLRGSTGQNNTDRAAMDQVIRHFDDHVEDALSGNLFSGSDAALDLYRKARGQFAAYQKTFRPQGAGDDVGRAMQQIVDRNAQPQEVANLLFGTSLTGNTGRAIRLADRLQEVLPAELWQQTQRGYLGRIVGDGVEAGKIVDNIEKALAGEGRGLSARLLEPEQVSGLRSIQSGLRAAAATREAVPAWVRDLGRKDFEPEAVIASLFGRGTTTSNVISAQYARGIRDVVGADSETWKAVRQAGWQNLTSKPEGATADFGPQALANRLTDFLERKGKSLADTLYSAEERATMKAFANVMKTMTPQRVAGGSASPNSDTAPMLMRGIEALKKHENKLALMLATVGFIKGGFGGAAAAYGITKGAQTAANNIAARKSLRNAREAASGAPSAPLPRPAPPSLPAFQNPLARTLPAFGE